EAKPEPATDKWVVMVPSDAVDAVRAGLFAAGAGALGNYRECCWSTSGTGQFRPVDGADPAIGSVGDLERVPEDRIEVIAPRRSRAAAPAAPRDPPPHPAPASGARA